MYNATSTFLTKIKEPTRITNAKVYINGVALYTDIISEFGIDSSFGSNNIPTIGSAVSSKLTLKLVNSASIPQVLVNVPIEPYVAIDIGGGVFEWIPLGIFYATTGDVIKSTLNTDIECFDRMATFDNYQYTTPLTFPNTTSQVLSDIATRYSIPFLSQPTLPNSAVKVKPEGTLRQVISQMALLMSKNATMTERGQVCFKYVATSGFTMDASNYFNFKRTSSANIIIDKLTVTGNEEDVSYGQGSNFALSIETPQITTQAELQTIYDIAFPLEFTPYELNAQGMPHIQLGDIITVTDVNSVHWSLFVINHKFNFNGGMTSSFTVSAPEKTTSVITTSSGSTISDVVNVIYNNVNSSLDLITGNQGGEIVTVYDPVTGKPTDFCILTDTSDINTAKKLWRWNSGGLAYLTDGFGGLQSTVAITNDGKIQGEVINAKNITVTDNLGNETFKIDSDGNLNINAIGNIKSNAPSDSEYPLEYTKVWAGRFESYGYDFANDKYTITEIREGALKLNDECIYGNGYLSNSHPYYDFLSNIQVEGYGLINGNFTVRDALMVNGNTNTYGVTSTQFPTIKKYKDLGSYNYGSGNITGTMKIVLPVSWTSTMMNIEIDGYDYSSNASWKLVLGGYNYMGTPTSMWTNLSATLIGNAPFTSVRFAYDSTTSQCCILLGVTTTTWAYPKVVISHLIAGHSNYLNFVGEWIIGVTTSEVGITSIVSTPLKKLIQSTGGVMTGDLTVPTLNTYGIGGVSGDWYTSIPIVSSGGITEIGKYLDFHELGTGTTDFDGRLSSLSGGIIRSENGFSRVGKAPAFSWTGTIAINTATTITHSLGYRPLLHFDGTVGNVIITTQDTDVNNARIYANTNAWTGTIYFY